MRKLIPLILILALSSCEKLIMPKGNRPADIEVYDDIWKTLNNGYAFFDMHEFNWDSVRTVYGEKFFDTMTQEQFFDTCADMLSHFKDGSIVLDAGFDTYRYRAKDTLYSENFDRLLLDRRYLKDAKQTGPFKHTIIDSVGYIFYESFEGKVNPEHLDIIINQYLDSNVDIQGVIFDIRNNGGGNIENVFTICRRMGLDTVFNYNTLLYKTQYKNGTAQGHFTDLQPAWVEQETKPKFPKRFVVLTNRNTRNTANIFAVAALAYGNVKIYGDTTGGGDGKITARELPNGWILKYPSTRLYTHDNDLVSFGMWPHKIVQMSPADAVNGKDSIIEEAMYYIKNP